MSTTPHAIELYADNGEIRTRLVCTAAPDAACRKRPAVERESWDNDDPDLTPGHPCWATEWIEETGFEDGAAWGSRDGVIASVPVRVSYNEGVSLGPVQEGRPMAAADQSTPRVGDAITTAEQLGALPVGSVVLDIHNDAGLVDFSEAVRYAETAPLGFDYVVEKYGPLTVLHRPDAPHPTPVERAALLSRMDPESWLTGGGDWLIDAESAQFFQDAAAVHALAARGDAAPSEVEWGVRWAEDSDYTDPDPDYVVGDRGIAESWASTEPGATLMRRTVSAWREVRDERY